MTNEERSFTKKLIALGERQARSAERQASAIDLLCATIVERLRSELEEAERRDGPRRATSRTRRA
jgi:hypothetical protein